LWAAILALAWVKMSAGALPQRFIPRGVGGGGAFFGPSINPHNRDEVYVASDMSDLFRSKDLGGSWEMLDFRSMRGHERMGSLQFTSDPNILYGLNSTVPAKSSDGGITWSNIPVSAQDIVIYSVLADPAMSTRVLAADYSKVYFSTNGGKSYATVFTSNNLHVAGAFFDGARIFVGTRAGLLISTNSGKTFSLSPIGGIVSGEAMVSFAGAREGSTSRLVCVTWNSSYVYPGCYGLELDGYKSVYRLDYGISGSWAKATNGLTSNLVAFVAMCPTNVSTVYLAGTTAQKAYPAVCRSVNGGAMWTNIFQYKNNKNICTGWRGDTPAADAWQKWWWGPEPLGFNVCPSDPQRVAVTDLGFVHITTNGGAVWSQAYVYPADENNASALTPAGKAYHSAGLENTACWSMEWAESNCIIGCYTDIHGTRSTDGGATWTFPTGLVHNTMYDALAHPTNRVIYAAVSSVHNMYVYEPYLQDAYIDGGTGTVVYSRDCGLNWIGLPGVRYPVVDMALDPNNPNRMYIAQVNSSAGGIFVSDNFQQGAGTTWRKLTNPPRTQGHPYRIHVLNDGTLVCAYSGRISGGDLTDSAGVFVSTDGGATWTDRTGADMRYYTMDLTIDPHDAAQNTWYAGVYEEGWSSLGVGGLYRTTNRGATWTRITTGLDCVSSCTVNPLNSNEMYVATEYQGLWMTANARASTPVFTEVPNYPFKHPTRIFFNPYNLNEMWVTSYGGGLMLGRQAEPQPMMCELASSKVAPTQLVVEASSGQKLVLRASSDLVHWQDIATNTVTDTFTEFTDPAAASSERRFYVTVVVP